MVASYSKTPSARCHVVNPRKIAIVSRAFSPPADASPEMVDKLARLNEWMLAKTISVEQRSENGFWIPFHSDQWIAEFGARYYVGVKNTAISMGMMEWNRKYSTGGPSSPSGAFPESGRLAPEYRDGSFRQFEMRKVSRKRQPNRNNKSLGLAGAWLASKLPEFQVGDVEPRTALEALSKALFNRGIHRPHRCSYGRFHSVGTSLSKYLRASLSTTKIKHMVRAPKEESPLPPVSSLSSQTFTKGKTPGKTNSLSVIGMGWSDSENGYECRLKGNSCDLVQIDVANCQALYLASQLKQADLAPQFVDLTEQGILYEYLAAWLQRGDVPPYQVRTKRGRTIAIDPSTWQRNKAKKGFMVWLFNSVDESKTSPIGQAIERLWPEVAELSYSIKAGHYQGLAHQCQRFESSIVIDGVCGHLAEHQPDLPVLTVHDCLIVPHRAQDLINELMLEFFQRQGVTPQLKIEPLAA